jgi:hypothetical protein
VSDWGCCEAWKQRLICRKIQHNHQSRDPDLSLDTETVTRIYHCINCWNWSESWSDFFIELSSLLNIVSEWGFSHKANVLKNWLQVEVCAPKCVAFCEFKLDQRHSPANLPMRASALRITHPPTFVIVHSRLTQNVRNRVNQLSKQRLTFSCIVPF